ncbi:MAG TPA: D-aminoacyl-tRNA deacylase [Thermoplasmata archaeon]|nr:D-aminoacyl-tRNA deacylase [Thermoplasmata archaeon]
MREEPVPRTMRVLVASAPDPASLNQRAALCALATWEEAGRFEGSPVLAHGRWTLLTIRELHLERDHLDRDIEATLGTRPELLVYLSKHRSESRTPSLTVHPIGNPKAAEFGGKPGTFVPASPAWMTAALRRLRIEAQELPYEVTFEATHHGPYLETPTFFIEQGSTEREWEDLEASKAIARTLLDLRPAEAPAALGLGGGHYVPRHSDLAVARRIAFGHMLPSHSLEGLPPDRIDAAISGTPGASLAYLHRKSLGKPEARELEALVSARGLRVVREADLPPLEENKAS